MKRVETMFVIGALSGLVFLPCLGAGYVGIFGFEAGHTGGRPGPSGALSGAYLVIVLGWPYMIGCAVIAGIWFMRMGDKTRSDGSDDNERDNTEPDESSDRSRL